MRFAGYLTMAEVAELRGTHRTSAFRWVQRNAPRHIRHIGRFPVISATTYRRLTLADHLDDKFTRITGRLDDLEDETADLAQRLDALVRRVASQRAR